MRFRRPDHESYIGGYDPEHEMPDPDRSPRDRWESDAYRRNARDSRYAYRWNPDRFESRDDWMRRRAMERDIQPRDRYEPYDRPWDRGYDRGYDYDREYDRHFDRGRSQDDYDRDREYLSRGYPRPYAWETRFDRENWERDYENEYWGRPSDPRLRWDRERGRRY